MSNYCFNIFGVVVLSCSMHVCDLWLFCCFGGSIHCN